MPSAHRSGPTATAQRYNTPLGPIATTHRLDSMSHRCDPPLLSVAAHPGSERWDRGSRTRVVRAPQKLHCTPQARVVTCRAPYMPFVLVSRGLGPMHKRRTCEGRKPGGGRGPVPNQEGTDNGPASREPPCAGGPSTGGRLDPAASEGNPRVPGAPLQDERGVPERGRGVTYVRAEGATRGCSAPRKRAQGRVGGL